jgi:small subunit ribosomal protein S17
MAERNLRRTIQGVVVSNKNDKTIGVLVETHKKHAKYGKRVKYRKKYYAHDENNQAKLGDVVTIMECRKLSATKRYRLVSIDKAADLSIKELEAEVVAEEERIVEEVEAKAEKPEAEKVEETEEVKAEEKEAE